MRRQSEREELDDVLSCMANAIVLVANAWAKMPEENRRAALSALTDIVLATSDKKRTPARVLRLVPKRGRR